MASSRRFSAALKALVPLGCIAVAGLLDCGGNVDPTATTGSGELTARPSTQPAVTGPGGSGAPQPLSAANHFDLSGDGLHVSYYQSAGVPVFVYEDAIGSRTFRGSEIEIDATPVGTLVTVVTRLTIDSGSTTFSVLVPRVTLEGGSTPVRTQGITTVHRFAVVKSAEVGQLDEYDFKPLQGTGSQALDELGTPVAELHEGVVPPLHAPNN